MDDINVLMPETIELKLSFGSFKIEPLEVTQILKFIRFYKPMSKEIMSFTKSAEENKTDLSAMDMFLKFAELFEGRIDEGLTFILNSETPITQKKLSLIEGLKIFTAILKVNDIVELKATFSAAMLSLKEKFPELKKMFAPEKTTLTSSSGQ